VRRARMRLGHDLRQPHRSARLRSSQLLQAVQRPSLREMDLRRWPRNTGGSLASRYARETSWRVGRRRELPDVEVLSGVGWCISRICGFCTTHPSPDSGTRTRSRPSVKGVTGVTLAVTSASTPEADLP
jgi:hypothetical protein